MSWLGEHLQQVVQAGGETVAMMERQFGAIGGFCSLGKTRRNCTFAPG